MKTQAQNFHEAILQKEISNFYFWGISSLIVTIKHSDLCCYMEGDGYKLNDFQ